MTTFKDLGLAPELLRAVSELGFETPTQIQSQTIPLLVQEETDLLALAQTGTGKTAAFGLPLLQRIDPRRKGIQALVISPTRELCMQIARDMEAFGKFYEGFSVVAVYGGSSIQNQLKQIADGAQVVVATPGRLTDIMQRKKHILENVKIAVLDEADEMLNMGFRDDMETILSYTPAEKQTWLFSATMPNEVLSISRNFMHKPKELSSGEKNTANKNIEHKYFVVHARDKYMALKRIADFHPDIFAIVFCRTKIETQQIADMLIKDGYNADALHGDLSQAQRDVVMKRYRNRNLQLLVATDVAARGIDVDDVTHVIHYSLPDEPENYTHRSGRTARAGKKGVSMALINMKEIGKIKMIERIVKNNFTREQLPDGPQVCEQQVISMVKKVHNVHVNREEIEPFLPVIAEELDGLSKEEIITRFISVEFNRFLNYYRNAPDLNAYGNNEEFSHGGGIKMFLTLGSLDGLNKQGIKEFVAKTAGIDEAQIPWVDVKNSYSFVEVNAASVEKVQAAFKEVTYNGRRAQIELRERSGRDRDGGGRERRGSGRNDRGGDNRGGGYRGRNDRSQGGGDRSRRGGESRSYSGSRGQENRNSNSGGKNQWSKPKNDKNRDRSGFNSNNNFANPPKNKKESMALSAELKSIFEMDKKELRRLEKQKKKD